MDAETREKIHKILDLVIDRNEGGNTTFFHFSGHVNVITVHLHNGEWESNKDWEEHVSYIKRPKLDESLDEVIEALC